MSNKPPLTVTDLARMGGKARAAKLTRAERVESAVKANRARWDAMSESELAEYRESCRLRALESWKRRKGLCSVCGIHPAVGGSTCPQCFAATGNE